MHSGERPLSYLPFLEELHSSFHAEVALSYRRCPIFRLKTTPLQPFHADR